MIHTGAGATMIVITTLITDTTITILIMDITITILTMGITTIIHIMDITTIIILLIAIIGKIITITTKTLMEIPLVSILQLMVEEGMILAVMKIIITKMVVPPVLMRIIITLMIVLLVLIISIITIGTIVMIIPQEVIIITIIIITIPMITPHVPTNRIQILEIVEVAVEDFKELEMIFNNTL